MTGRNSYLSNAADILVAVFLREAQVLVQAEANIVAVEPVGGKADMKQVLLKGSGNGRLSRGRETREPNSKAALATELVSLMARERWMPGNVAIAGVNTPGSWAGARHICPAMSQLCSGTSEALDSAPNSGTEKQPGSTYVAIMTSVGLSRDGVLNVQFGLTSWDEGPTQESIYIWMAGS